MAVSIRSLKASLVLSLIIVLLLSLSLPLIASASELIQTIQIGSYAGVHDARRYYESVASELSEEELGFLRIEKIGRFYAVRLGNFDNYDETANLLRSVKPKFSSAMIMTAYMKDERLVTMYTVDTVEEQAVPESGEEKKFSPVAENESAQLQPVPEPEKIEVILPPSQEKKISRELMPLEEVVDSAKEIRVGGAESEEEGLPIVMIVFSGLVCIVVLRLFLRIVRSKYVIQTGSFASEEEAGDHYKFVVQTLSEEEREYLRIEKAGEAYAVRVGKFGKQSAAMNLLMKLKAEFPPSMIMKVSKKDEGPLNIYEKEPEVAVGKSSEDVMKVYTAKEGGGLSVVVKKAQENDADPEDEEINEPQFADETEGQLKTSSEDDFGVSSDARESQLESVDEETVDEDREEEFPWATESETPECQTGTEQQKEEEVSDEEPAEDQGREILNFSGSFDEPEGKEEWAQAPSDPEEEEINKPQFADKTDKERGTSSVEQLEDRSGLMSGSAESVDEETVDENSSVILSQSLGIEESESVPLVTVKDDRYTDRYAERDVYKEKSLDEDNASHLSIERCKKVIEKNPDMPEAYYNLGIASSMSGKYKDAIEAYTRAIKLSTDFLKAYYNLGIVYSKAGRYPEAIDAYQKAIHINPEYPKAYYNLGIAYRKSGRYEDAIEAYTMAGELDPNFEKAHYNLGIAYSKSGMYENAIESYKKAIQINPNFEKARYNLEVAYSKSGIDNNPVET